MKKYIVFIITVNLIILLQLEVYAELDLDKLPKHELYQDRVIGNTRYSNDDFSINIPNDYTQITENTFGNEEGENINIEIVPFSGGNPYTEDNLNKAIQGIYSNIDSIKEKVRNNTKEQYGNYLSDSEIENYVASLKINSIDKKEISFFSKNNYKCFHIITNLSMIDYESFSEQYVVFSIDKAFIITISVNDKEKLENSEIKNTVNSFTIFNYEEPTKVENESFISDDVIDEMITDAIAAAIIVTISGVIGYFHRKNKKKLENNQFFSEDDN